MTYKIIEVHIEYTTDVNLPNAISILAVLWQSNEKGWVRASFCTTVPCSGYKFLLSRDKLSDDLIQQVAAQGMNLPDDLKAKYFPGLRPWER